MIVYVLFHAGNESIEGIYKNKKDAQDMMYSFGKEMVSEFSIEEHEVIE